MNGFMMQPPTKDMEVLEPLLPLLTWLSKLPDGRWLARLAGYPSYAYCAASIGPEIQRLKLDGRLVEILDHRDGYPPYYANAAHVFATGGCSHDPECALRRVQLSFVGMFGPSSSTETCIGDPMAGDPRFVAVDTYYGQQRLLAAAVDRVLDSPWPAWCWVSTYAGSWMLYGTTTQKMRAALGC